ncbi:MAG: ArsR/SmtB family transcription factor [Gemmatimonadales bacterium]
MAAARSTRVTLLPGQFELIAKALADPRRFALLEAIVVRQECPCQRLTRDFPISKATISHHVRELALAGLVAPQRQGRFVRYRVRSAVLRAYVDALRRRLTPSCRS